MPDPITPPAPLAMKDLITEAGLADRGWAKDYLDKPLDKDTTISFLKKLDGAETLIGKKTLVPGADAKPEELDEFFGKVRPEKADDYAIEAGEKPDEGFIKAVRESFHDGRLHKHQAQKVLAKLVPFLKERETIRLNAAAAEKAKNDEREAAFETMLKEAVGPEYEKKSARVQQAIKELVPESARQYADKIDDKSLVLVTAVVDALLSKYAKEDDFKGDGGGGGGKQEDKNTLVEELKKLYAEPARNDFRHADHEKINKRINEILAHPALSK